MENEMTPEEQQITIAQAYGWKLRWQNRGGAPLLDQKPKGHCWEVWIDPSGWGLDNNFDPIYPPDYLNDLNAMHEVEKVLNADQCAEYVRYLALDHPTFCILPSEESDEVEVRYQYFSLINATAAQRAEAFLKTLNLWKP